MKPMTIIAISVGLSVVAVLGILVAFTPVSQPQVQETPEINLDNQAELDEIERQRKINSMLNTGGSEYGDNSGNVEYWERAKLGTIKTGDDSAFNACVQGIVGKYFSPATAQEFYELTKAKGVCSHLMP